MPPRARAGKKRSHAIHNGKNGGRPDHQRLSRFRNPTAGCQIVVQGKPPDETEGSICLTVRTRLLAIPNKVGMAKTVPEVAVIIRDEIYEASRELQRADADIVERYRAAGASRHAFGVGGVAEAGNAGMGAASRQG